VAVTGALAQSQAADSLSATATISGGTPIVGALDITQESDFLSATATTPVPQIAVGGWWQFKPGKRKRRRLGELAEPSNSEIAAAQKAERVLREIAADAIEQHLSQSAAEDAGRIARRIAAARGAQVARELDRLKIAVNAYAKEQFRLEVVAAVNRRREQMMDDEAALVMILQVLA
jgi:hypothetical protein